MSLEKKYPKVLIISDATWSNSNNIGNTYTNLFGGWDADNIAMIYARGDLPENGVCEKYFQIAESRIIRRFFDKSVKTGVEIKKDINTSEDRSIEKDVEDSRKIYSFFKKFRWNIFLMARNMLWRVGRWRTPELDDFIDSYNPDAVFALACEGSYINNIQQYVIRKSGKKAAIYFVDDIYSMRQFSLSPFYWANKLLSRVSIRKTTDMCEKVYTIVSDQKEEYDRCFGKSSEVINKGGKFEEPPERSELNYPLKLVYSGNISAVGRWETLAKVGKALDEINSGSEKAKLYISTTDPLDTKVKKAFDGCKSIEFMGKLPIEEVEDFQRGADILVHVEAFNLRDRLKTRLSFSTKLVDYFERGKCILAIGWEDSASILYLKEEDAAVVVDDIELLKSELENLISDPNRIEEYGKKGWELGRRKHSIEEIRNRLRIGILELSEGGE